MNPRQPIVADVEVLQVDQCVQALDLGDRIRPQVEFYQRSVGNSADGVKLIGTNAQFLKRGRGFRRSNLIKEANKLKILPSYFFCEFFSPIN